MPDFKNCHFPGLWSIVLSEQDGLLTRAYIMRPGWRHDDLRVRQTSLLAHRHAYSFTSTTRVGTVINRVFDSRIVTENANRVEHFKRYRLTSGITGSFALSDEGVVEALVESKTQACGPGQAYGLQPHELHSVEFHPDPETGWFVAIIEETARAEPVEYAYSLNHRLHLTFDSSDLYQPISKKKSRRLLSDLNDAYQRTIVALVGAATSP